MNISINQKNTNTKKLRITGWVFIYNGLVLKAKKPALRSCLLKLWMSSCSDFMLCKLVWTNNSKNVGIKHSLLTHREFSTSPSVFEAKAIPLRAAGPDKRPNKSCSLYKEVKKLQKWLSFPSSPYTHTMVAFHIAFWVTWQTGAPHDATMQAEYFSTQKDNNDKNTTK